MRQNHYADFLELAVPDCGPRLEQALALLERILRAEGGPYAATFVLDHDDPVYTRELLQRAASFVLGASGRRGDRPQEGVFIFVTSCYISTHGNPSRGALTRMAAVGDLPSPEPC